MTDQTVGAIDQTGAGTKNIDVSEMVVNGKTVQRQRVALGDGATGANLAKVGSGGDLFVSRVGAGAMAPIQVALTGTTAVLVAAARTGAPGTGRRSITVINKTGVTVWLGTGSGVTSTTGLPLDDGDAVPLETTAAIYAVLDAAGTPTLNAYELY